MAKAVTHDPAAPAIQLHFGSVFFLFLFFFLPLLRVLALAEVLVLVLVLVLCSCAKHCQCHCSCPSSSRSYCGQSQSQPPPGLSGCCWLRLLSLSRTALVLSLSWFCSHSSSNLARPSLATSFCQDLKLLLLPLLLYCQLLLLLPLLLVLFGPLLLFICVAKGRRVHSQEQDLKANSPTYWLVNFVFLLSV